MKERGGRGVFRFPESNESYSREAEYRTERVITKDYYSSEGLKTRGRASARTADLPVGPSVGAFASGASEGVCGRVNMGSH